MSKPFDATTRELLEAFLRDWLWVLLRLDVEHVSVFDSDLSTITSEADKVLRIEEAKQILLLQGHKRFGPPDEPTSATIQAIGDLQRVETLAERLLDVSSWDELLATL